MTNPNSEAVPEGLFGFGPVIVQDTTSIPIATAKGFTAMQGALPSGRFGHGPVIVLSHSISVPTMPSMVTIKPTQHEGEPSMTPTKITAIMPSATARVEPVIFAPMVKMHARDLIKRHGGASTIPNEEFSAKTQATILCMYGIFVICSVVLFFTMAFNKGRLSTPCSTKNSQNQDQNQALMDEEAILIEEKEEEKTEFGFIDEKSKADKKDYGSAWDASQVFEFNEYVRTGGYLLD